MNETICYKCHHCLIEPCFTHFDGHKVQDPPMAEECVEGMDQFGMAEGCYRYEEKPDYEDADRL